MFSIFREIESTPDTDVYWYFQVDRKKLMNTVAVVFFNQTVVTLAFTHTTYYMMVWRGCQTRTQDLPTFHRLVFDVSLSILVMEFFFYYTHR